MIDIERHRDHAKRIIPYFSRRNEVEADWVVQRWLELALEYQAIVEQDELDLARTRKLADDIGAVPHTGVIIGDLLRRVRVGLLGDDPRSIE